MSSNNSSNSFSDMDDHMHFVSNNFAKAQTSLNEEESVERKEKGWKKRTRGFKEHISFGKRVLRSRSKQKDEHGEEEGRKKIELRVSLTKKEITEDWISLTGSKPTPWPNYRRKANEKMRLNVYIYFAFLFSFPPLHS